MRIKALQAALVAAIGCAPHGETPGPVETDVERRTAVVPEVRATCDLAVAPGSMTREEAQAQGQRDAALDLARERPSLISYDAPRPCHVALARALRERHGVGYRQIGHCVIDEAVSAYAEGYNATMHRHLAAAALVEEARRAGCLSAG